MKDITMFITFVGILLAVYMVKRVIYRRKSNHPYDERQLAVQGKAYKYAYFTAMIILVVEVMGDMMLGVMLLETNLLILFVVCISVAVFAITCIMKDAYVAPKTDMRMAWIVLGVIGIINVGMGVMDLVHHEVRIVGGTLVAFPTTLIAGVVLLMVVISYGIRKRQSDKENREG